MNAVKRWQTRCMDSTQRARIKPRQRHKSPWLLINRQFTQNPDWRKTNADNRNDWITANQLSVTNLPRPGTNGRSAICPSNRSAHRPGIALPQSGQHPFAVSRYSSMK